MSLMRSLAAAALLLTVGCAAFQTAGQFQSGRQALLRGEPETALAYFQQVAEKNPDYIFQSVNFREGIWTYVGRAQYARGNFAEARQSFERALSVYKDDPMAQLYLGMAMMRSGADQQGRRQLELGMKNLALWLDYLNGSRPLDAFWDPSGQIRKEIEKALTDLASEKSEPDKTLLASAEWVGQQMEEEIDRVRDDERRQFNRDRDRDFRRGPGVGIGIGF